MKKTVSITLHGITGRAFSKKDANLAARLALDSAVERIKTGPLVASVTGVNGHAATMAIPDENGWRYLTLAQPGKDMVFGQLALKCFSFGGSEDHQKIICDLTRHAAQLVWSHSEPNDNEFSKAAAQQCGTASAKVAADILRWCNFQRTYASEIEAGATPEAAYNAACRAESV